MHLYVPCYCHACFGSIVLRVGAMTLYNAPPTYTWKINLASISHNKFVHGICNYLHKIMHTTFAGNANGAAHETSCQVVFFAAWTLDTRKCKFFSTHVLQLISGQRSAEGGGHVEFLHLSMQRANWRNCRNYLWMFRPRMDSSYGFDRIHAASTSSSQWLDLLNAVFYKR